MATAVVGTMAPTEPHENKFEIQEKGQPPEIYFRLRKTASGPKLDYFKGGLNSPLLPQHAFEKVGGFAPHFFQWALRKERAV